MGILVLIMKVTGFRFDKRHRREETLVYRVLVAMGTSTVLLNLRARR